MATIHQGFQKILSKRLACVIVWHVAIVTATLQSVASFVALEELSLFSWLRSSLAANTLVVALFQLLLSAVFVVTESKQYLRLEHQSNVTRFQLLCQKLSPHNCLWFCIYLLRGIVSAIVFFVAFKHRLINSGPQRLTDSIIVLINDAIWTNLLFFAYESVYAKSFRYLPLVRSQQSSIVPKIAIIAKEVALKSIYCCALFATLYLCGGYSVCSFCCRLFAVKCNDLSYATIFDPFLVYCLWLLNAFILFNHSMLKLLFDVFVTSRMDFVIEPTEQNAQFTLKQALATANVPLFQYLAFYDLNVVSQFDAQRRKQIFSLSYPGGHAYVWRQICEEAMKLIVEANAQLEAVTAAATPKAPETAVKYPTVDFRMRSLAQSHLLPEKKPVDAGVSRKLVDFLRTLRPVSYMLEELKEKQLESALQHYQALSLACYSMANLAATSMVEDRFGIVQQDLPAIIHALLKLYMTLNKLVVVVNRKPNSSILQVKRYLIQAVKSSLYKLAIDFGPYVKDLGLSMEDEKLLTNFILFKN